MAAGRGQRRLWRSVDRFSVTSSSSEGAPYRARPMPRSGARVAQAGAIGSGGRRLGEAAGAETGLLRALRTCFVSGRAVVGPYGRGGRQWLARSVAVFSDPPFRRTSSLFRERSHEQCEKVNTIGWPRQWGQREKNRCVLMSGLRPRAGANAHTRTRKKGTRGPPGQEKDTDPRLPVAMVRSSARIRSPGPSPERAGWTAGAPPRRGHRSSPWPGSG